MGHLIFSEKSVNCVSKKGHVFYCLLPALMYSSKEKRFSVFKAFTETKNVVTWKHRRVHLSSCQSVAFLDPSPRITDHLLRISKCASLAALRLTLRFFVPWHPGPLASNRSQRPNLPLQLPSVSMLNQRDVKMPRRLWVVLGHQLAIQLCCFETPEPYQP